MSSTPSIWVRTPFFVVDAGEDAETNPGIYGRAFARWLANEFVARGVPVEEVFGDDWGWCVMLSRKPFRLWIGCANRFGRTDEWGAFVKAEPTLIQRLFRTAEVTPAVNHVYGLLETIMRGVPQTYQDVYRRGLTVASIRSKLTKPPSRRRTRGPP